MFRRSCLVVSACLLLVFSAAAQRRGGISGGSTADVTVRIVTDDGRPIRNLQIQVELQSAGGGSIGRTYSDMDGVARFPAVGQGTYKVAVSGLDIVDAVSPMFEIGPGQIFYTQDMAVKLKPQAEHSESSNDPMISARALNVPAKARKEFDKGNDAAHRNDMADAEKHYRKALEEYPQFSPAANNLGAICLHKKDYACARESFQKAVDADPHNASALLNVGRLKMTERNYGEARGAFMRALAIEPASPEALTLAANAEYVLHNYAEAVAYARRVPGGANQPYSLAHLIAARALEAEHKPQEAMLEYEAFLKEAPQNPAAPVARQALARLSQNGKAPQP